MTTDLLKLTITEAVAGLKKKEFSSRDLTQAHLDQMDSLRHLNAYITETPELALQQAADSDARLAKGEGRPLEGIPLGIKDLYCTKGVRTTAGSKILGNFIPTYESTVSQKLLDAGSVTLGKLNLDEFAMGSIWERKPSGSPSLMSGCGSAPLYASSPAASLKMMPEN